MRKLWPHFYDVFYQGSLNSWAAFRLLLLTACLALPSPSPPTRYHLTFRGRDLSLWPQSLWASSDKFRLSHVLLHMIGGELPSGLSPHCHQEKARPGPWGPGVSPRQVGPCISFQGLPQHITARWVLSAAEMCFLTVLESRSLNSSCWQGRNCPLPLSSFQQLLEVLAVLWFVDTSLQFLPPSSHDHLLCVPSPLKDTSQWI